MRPNGNSFLCNVFLASLSILFATLGFPAPSAGAGTLADACSGPVISSSFEVSEWTVPDSSSCYSIYFDEPAAWFVRAAAGPSADGVYLELPACSRHAGLQVLDRRLDSLLLDVREAGWRSICFGQIDRAGAPVEVTLISRVIAQAESKSDPTEEDPDPDPLVSGCERVRLAVKSDPTEEDPDPDPLVSGCERVRLAEKSDPTEEDPDPDPLVSGCERVRLAVKSDPTEEDPDPDPLVSGCERVRLAEKSDPTEEDPDPDPLTAGRCDSALTIARICQAVGAWGARQMPSCVAGLEAESWTEPAEGQLFRLEVSDWQSFVFEVDGEAELTVSDAWGQRLESHKLAPDGAAAGLEIRLAPGSYWVSASGDRLRYSASAF